MKLHMRGDRVAIRPDQQPTQTASGLHLVYDRQQTTMRGTVIALGDGPLIKGTQVPHIVTVGDKVIFSPDSGEELSFEHDVLLVMRELDILAVVE
ncbi:MAG: hypothetical protein NUW01_06665 [Gemmatimonadaceae bacterium]|nr:hypothetical protein [Gemmatimonadaceae bacterium]